MCVGKRLDIGRSEHLYCDEITGRSVYEIYVCMFKFMPVHLECIVLKKSPTCVSVYGTGSFKLHQRNEIDLENFSVIFWNYRGNFLCPPEKEGETSNGE